MAAGDDIEAVSADEVIADLSGYPNKLSKASVRSLNRALVAGRTEMARAIASDAGIGVRDVTKAMSQRKATLERAEAAFGATLRRIELIHFKARGPEPSRGKGRGVSYSGAGGKGRIPNAFIATMQSGHRGVFKANPDRYMRQQKPTWKKKRHAIVELFGSRSDRCFLTSMGAGARRRSYRIRARLERLTSGRSSWWAHQYHRAPSSVRRGPDGGEVHYAVAAVVVTIPTTT